MYAQRQEKEAWSSTRRCAYDLLEGRSFGTILGIVIATNCVCIVLETEIGARCMQDDSQQDCMPDWLHRFSAAFLVTYTFEVMLRIYAYRIAFFTNFVNVFDLLIIILGYVDAILTMMDELSLSGLQMLRVFRVAKLVRAARFIRLVPELHSMVRGFISSMSAMLWGFVMILVLLLFWAVLAVEFLSQVSRKVHGDESSCTQAFSGVFPAILMFFQTLMAGDDWGGCSIPLIKDPSHGAGAMFIFAGSLISIQLGFTNLILAVIVERAQDASDQDKQAQIMAAKNRRQEAENKLEQMCVDMDTNEDGIVSYSELTEAYEANEDFRQCLHMLEIDKGDLQHLFQLMDSDNSGDLSYEELIECIHRSDTNDLKRQVMMLKLQMEDIWLRVRNHLELGICKIMEKLDVDQPDGLNMQSLYKVSAFHRQTTSGLEKFKTPSPDLQPHPETSTYAIPATVPRPQNDHSPSPDAAILQELYQTAERVAADMSSLEMLNTASRQEVVQPLKSCETPASLSLPNPSSGLSAFIHLEEVRRELLELHMHLNERLVTVLDRFQPEHTIQGI